MAAVYLALHVLPSRLAFNFSAYFCMIYLTVCHLWRMYFDYGGYELDITGPLMVLVQRLTMLAANYDDGVTLKQQKEKKSFIALATSTPLHSSKQENNESPLSESQKELAVLYVPLRIVVTRSREMPDVLEFSSYCINFQTVIIGPLIPFRNYSVYIRGAEHVYATTDEEKKVYERERDALLAAKEALIVYGKQAAIFGFLYIFVSGYFPVSFYLTDEFLTYSLTKRFLYLWATCTFMRQHYYFGWSISALCCLMSGLGFNGFDSELKPKYTLVKNFRFRSVEFAGSVKELIDNWNISTLQWLRLVIFDRVPKQYSTLAVFASSCVWHGFYPGYYLFFVSMAWFSMLGRKFRQLMRPRLFAKFTGAAAPPQHPRGENWLERTSVFTNIIMPALGFSEPTVNRPTVKQARQDSARIFSQRYDVFTWFVTYTVVNYSALSFVILGLEDSLVVWSRLYYSCHLLGLACHIALASHT